MFPVIIQDCLPAVSLQFQRILRLRVKGDADLGLVVVGLGTMPAGVRKIPLGNVFRPGISAQAFSKSTATVVWTVIFSFSIMGWGVNLI
jgi:hypothetical protein